MASKLDDIYLRLSPWAQNLALDLKGRAERRVRFGGEYRQFARDISRRRGWSRQQFAEHQLDQFNQVIASALAHVPFYRELYSAQLGSDIRLRSLDDARKLPIVEKKTLRARNTEFVNSSVPQRDLLQIKTTGTTGTPVTVYTTAQARRLNYAYYNEFLDTLGVDPFGKRIVVGGRVILSASQSTGPYWRISRSMNTVYLSSYHINRTNLKAYAEAINKWDVEYFDAYPSSMWLLAELLDQAQIEVRPPRAIITSAETLHPEQRQLIEKVFQAPIYDQYGAAEMCMFVAQCKAGRYHVRPDYCSMEIIKDGREASPGEVGDVVCTGFVNMAMPLIRYKVGDLAAWDVDQSCKCGLSAPVVQQIVGRQDDMIVCLDGRRVGRLSPVLKGFPVREAQYVQREPGRVIVRIAKAEGYSDADTENIRRELRKRLGDDMQMAFEFVDAVPRGSGGKFRAVVSELDATSRGP